MYLNLANLTTLHWICLQISHCCKLFGSCSVQNLQHALLTVNFHLFSVAVLDSRVIFFYKNALDKLNSERGFANTAWSKNNNLNQVFFVYKQINQFFEVYLTNLINFSNILLNWPCTRALQARTAKIQKFETFEKATEEIAKNAFNERSDCELRKPMPFQHWRGSFSSLMFLFSPRFMHSEILAVNRALHN